MISRRHSVSRQRKARVRCRCAEMDHVNQPLRPPTPAHRPRHWDLRRAGPAGPRAKRVVRAKGIEPPRPCGHWILNPARLPVPPRPLQCVNKCRKCVGTFLRSGKIQPIERRGPSHPTRAAIGPQASECSTSAASRSRSVSAHSRGVLVVIWSHPASSAASRSSAPPGSPWSMVQQSAQ